MQVLQEVSGGVGMRARVGWDHSAEITLKK